MYSCPFCQTNGFTAEYSGPLTPEARARIKEEETKVKEIELRMRLEEIEQDRHSLISTSSLSFLLISISQFHRFQFSIFSPDFLFALFCPYSRLWDYFLFKCLSIYHLSTSYFFSYQLHSDSFHFNSIFSIISSLEPHLFLVLTECPSFLRYPISDVMS